MGYLISPPLIGVGFRFGTKSAYNNRFYFGDNIVTLLQFFANLYFYFITHLQLMIFKLARSLLQNHLE